MSWGEYLAIAGAVAVGTIALTEAIARFFEWLYPDLPTAHELADERAQHHAHGDCFPAPPARTFSDLTIAKFAPLHPSGDTDA